MTTELKIHADMLDGETLQQIYRLRDHPSVDGLVAIMPDAHAGAGCVIGTTLTFKGSVCPNIVGVDVGCGMRAQRLGNIEIDFTKLDAEIKRGIPLGMRHREPKTAEKVISHYSDRMQIGAGLKDTISDCIEVQKRLDIGRNPVGNQLGTLGGGNHFIGATRSVCVA